MNNIDKQYTELLQDILDNGMEKSDRTGTGTLSVFGRQIRHKMSEGFPLLTTKKLHWKSIVTELLWFLRGDTNIKYLVDNGCHIWNGDAYKNYSNQVEMEWRDGAINELSEGGFIVEDSNDGKNINYRLLTQKEFIERIKTDDEFAKTWGELGPIYGKQWRNWNTRRLDRRSITQDRIDGITPHTLIVDQIQNLINELKTNPDSRRLMVSAWNPAELEKMVLPPCHYGFQLYTRELSFEERLKIANDNNNWVEDVKLDYERGIEANLISYCNIYNIPTRAISLMWNQRSVDTFLGLPFNIASYGLLLEIIAKEVNMVPDELIGNLGDVHLYSNHIEQAKEQIVRTTYNLPKLKFDKQIISNILSQEKIGRDNFNVVNADDFKLENYQSHPSIKAPLSN